MYLINIKKSILIGFFLMICSGLAYGASSLKASSAFPTQTELTQQFLKFIGKINEDNELGLKINYLGGPEVVPPKQQGQAVEHGIISMSYGPANYYLSQVPEGEALIASTLDAPEARRNGGMDVLSSIYEKKMNAHLLGWFGSGRPFHIYTVNRPQFSEAGIAENTVRIRSVQIYRDLLKGMGFTPVTVQVPNVYTSLQRGVVDGVAWSTIGLDDLGWDKYLNYRIEPGFFNSPTMVLVNLDSWNELTREQRDRLQGIANDFEKTAERDFKMLGAKSWARLREKGMREIKLKGEALEKYQALAREVPWKAFERYNGTREEELKAHFTPDLVK